MGKWKADGLGRYCDVHAGRVICGGGSKRIWCSGRAGSSEKTGKIQDAFPNYCFQPVAVDNLGEQFSCWFRQHPWTMHFFCLRRRQRICLPFLTHFYHHSMLQQYSVVRVFSPWRPRPIVIPRYFFLTFVFSPRDLYSLRHKNIIIIINNNDNK